MVIIFQTGEEFWIESIIVPRTTILAAASLTTDSTLERAGVFLGSSGTLDGNEAVTVTPDVALTVKRTTGGQLTIGLNITAVRSQIQNNDAGSVLMGAKILVFMRKNQ